MTSEFRIIVGNESCSLFQRSDPKNFHCNRHPTGALDSPKGPPHPPAISTGNIDLFNSVIQLFFTALSNPAVPTPFSKVAYFSHLTESNCECDWVKI